MSDQPVIRYELDGDIAVITIDNPPVNALGIGVREGIVDALGNGNADPRVRAFVLIGAGKHFIAGADIRRFGTARPMSTRTSAAAIESSGKPVVAAVDGHALGGGFEHVLACHYRLCTARARFGLPEVSLGLVPGGGGTQRLPRMVGVELALDLILTGRKMDGNEAHRSGLVDELVEPFDLRAAAVRHARAVADRRPLPSARDMRPATGVDVTAAIDKARKAAARKSRHLPAPLAAIECVEASLALSLEDGVAMEQHTFERLEQSDQSKALRYAFFAEREAAKIPGAPLDLATAEVRSGAVIGAGTMGAGIAVCFADAGIPVKVLEATSEALDRGMQRVRATYADRLKRGSLTQEDMDRRLALIEPVDRYEAIADCDAVIEAVFERIDLKKDVFSRLEAVMKPGALLLTNSSAIDIDVMAGVTSRPGDVAGAHFFAPANVMKLCEVVRGNASTMATILRATRLGRTLGKISVVAGIATVSPPTAVAPHWSPR